MDNALIVILGKEKKVMNVIEDVLKIKCSKMTQWNASIVRLGKWNQTISVSENVPKV